MTWEINALLALPFTLGNTNLSVKTNAGTFTAAITGTGRTYRHCLAPTSGSTRDLLREVAAALGAATGDTWSVTLHSSGRVRVALVPVGTISLLSVPGNAVWEALGFTTTRLNVGEALGDYPPLHLGIATGAWGGELAPTRPAGGNRNAGARVYHFAAGSWSYDRTWTLDLVPQSPEDAAAQDTPATPWLPSKVHLNSVGTVTGRGPSWLDLYSEAANKLVAWCDEWPTAEAVDSTPYLLGYVGADALDAPKGPPRDVTHPVWRQVELPFVTDGATSTRA